MRSIARYNNITIAVIGPTDDPDHKATESEWQSQEMEFNHREKECQSKRKRTSGLYKSNNTSRPHTCKVGLHII